MSTSSRRDRYTYQDYLAFPDDGQRYEVIFGEKHVNPSPIVRHQLVSMNLIAMLLDCRERGIGQLLSAPIDVLLADDCVVVPDIIFISAERAHIIEDSLIRGAPDLVIEVLSPSTRRTDQVKKLRLYERYGVREYWIADPEASELSRFVRTEQGSRLALEHVYTGDDELSSSILPGLVVPMGAVFR